MKASGSSTKSAALLAGALAAILASVGCSNERANAGSDEPGDVDGAAAGGVAGASGDGSGSPRRLYAVTSQVLGETPTSYLSLVQDLGAREEADLAKAFELPGRALAVGPTEGKYVLVATSEGPTLTRYDISDDGKFEKGATLSFLNEGVGSLLAFAQQFVFVSRNKAYFLDDTDGAQLIVFDPEEMSVVKTVPLDGVLRDGWSLTYGLSAKLRGDELVFTTSYYDDERSVFDAETRLVIVDTTTDSVKSVETETRCGYLLSSVVHSSGDIYFASNIYTSVVAEALGDEFGGPSCVLRLPAGERAFDDDFLLDLERAAGDTVAGSLIAGQGDRFYTRVLDRALLPRDEPTSDPVELSYLPVYRWAEVDLEAGALRSLDALGPGAAQSVEYAVDGRSFIGLSTADFASTTLLDFGEEPPREGMTFTGIPFSIVRVR